MDHFTSWFQSPWSFFSPSQVDPPTPSYRGTGAVAARRQTLTKHSSKPFDPTASLLIDRGLTNRPGENNCFLNAAVQILWHTDVFRKSFRDFEGHTCDGEPCIFCALKVLFTQYQHSGQSALPPDVLRNAMANCYEDQRKFQLGLMDDAAECFEKILEQIHYHLTGSVDLDVCSTPWCISHQKFALTTVEQSVCQCGAMAEPLSFVEFVHYVSTSVIVNESERLKSSKRSREIPLLFDQCLHTAGATGEARFCQHYPKCKNLVQFKRTLLNAPDVVCIGLIWDSESPPISYIMNVVDAISTKIHTKQIFDIVVSDTTRDVEYHLSAMITYYGRHYSTFCFHSHKQQWIYFDDAKFRKVGSDWSHVVEECRKAHFQPLLLLYCNPNGTTVDTSKAPTDVTQASHTDTSTHVHMSSGDRTVSASTYITTTTNTMTSTPNAFPSSDITSTSTSTSAVPSIYSQPSVQQSGLVSQMVSQYNQTKDVNKLPFSSNGPLQQPMLNTGASTNITTNDPHTQQQEQMDDLIQFSLTPSQIESSDTNLLNNMDITHISQAGVITHPFITSDSKMDPNKHTPGKRISPISDVITDNVNLRSSTSGVDAKMTRGINLDRLYKQNLPYSGATSTHLYPNLSTEQWNTKESKPYVHVRSKSPVIPKDSGRKEDNTTPPIQTPTGRAHDLRHESQSSSESQSNSENQSSSENHLEYCIKSLPKAIRDTLLDIGICLQKAKSYKDDDAVVSAILLDSAINKMHSVLSQPSIVANRSLHQHLFARKQAIQKLFDVCVHEDEFSIAKSKCDSQALQALLTDMKRSTTTATSVLQNCLECKQPRMLNETLLCGPCRLKLRIHN